MQEDVHLALSQLQGLGFDAGAAMERAELLLELRTYVSICGETMHTGQDYVLMARVGKSRF